MHETYSNRALAYGRGDPSDHAVAYIAVSKDGYAGLQQVGVPLEHSVQGRYCLLLTKESETAKPGKINFSFMNSLPRIISPARWLPPARALLAQSP
jgi:hypothetical protein